MLGAALLLPASAASGAPTVPPPIRAAADFALAGELTQGGWLRGTAPPGTRTVTFDGEPIPLDRDGAFFVAFDRDASASAVLTAKLADGRTVTRALAIAPRSWRIENVDTPLLPPEVPDAEFRRRRAAELAQIAAARATRTDAAGWRQRFVWPAAGRISGLFGAQRIYRGTPAAYHTGLDIAGAAGTPFVAPADGVVILAAAEPFTLEGHLLMIDHGMGLSSAFLHCSALLVRVGDHVRQGQALGLIGMTGRATGPHLHWGLKWREARLDPLLFVGRSG
ncbi:MAG: M23 family metallopeptidase [Novosphingobium sp.]|nr:M23 family metallopeptidase [Novosphingobium sp.]